MGGKTATLLGLGLLGVGIFYLASHRPAAASQQPPGPTPPAAPGSIGAQARVGDEVVVPSTPGFAGVPAGAMFLVRVDALSGSDILVGPVVGYVTQQGVTRFPAVPPPATQPGQGVSVSRSIVAEVLRNGQPISVA